MTRPLTALAALLLLAAPALADGKVYVQLPEFGAFAGNEAETLLEQVVQANVVSSNCPDYAVTDAEWSLLTDSADLLARGELGLSIDDYDRYFYAPAFDLLDKPDTCAKEGPAVELVLEELVYRGGSREPLADQDAGYAADQARTAAWDAADAKRRSKSP